MCQYYATDNRNFHRDNNPKIPMTVAAVNAVTIREVEEIHKNK